MAENDYSIIQTLPTGINNTLSVAGTPGNEGFPQQTFLGASIRSFNVSAGFGDSVSSLSVQLVNDEFNKSDGTPTGEGDDPYHNGLYDQFIPPIVGTPVYFKFGKELATVEQAYQQIFDDTYGDARTTETVGRNHFVFGGILQSYNQNRGPGGNPLYSVNVADPREILGNCTVLLNNYQGTTFNNKNLFNIYGFLEYDLSGEGLSKIESGATKNVLTKSVDAEGNVSYTGDDTYSYSDEDNPSFPITGQGFSRRSERGIPWYRVHQGLKALFSADQTIPQEYVDAGFGGTVDFRGYKYIVDFGGIPIEKISDMYYLDFDKLTLLEIAQELCDVISHELYITLLPIIDHPGDRFLYTQNRQYVNGENPEKMITGIIRVDAIDKSKQPKYGAIKSYIDNLDERGIVTENQDVGFELSNLTTDKFVVGAQEVEMYYFNNNKDRDNLLLRKQKGAEDKKNAYEKLQIDQWSLETSLTFLWIPWEKRRHHS